MKFKHMFSPIQIGPMTVKNRFVVPPMGNNFAKTDGTWSDESVAYYAERAKGQFGLITIEATVVHKGAKGGPRKPCLYDDNSIESLKKITDACHAEGAKISIQLQNAGPDATAKETADREGVDIRLYRVIYNAIEDVEAAMKGMLDPVFEEKVLGHAEVRQTFKASGVGTIAGSYVLDGVFERDCSVRLTRDGIVIFEGPLASLKRFKDDVKEVKAGYECGFVFANFNDIKEGDHVEAFKMVEIPR